MAFAKTDSFQAAGGSPGALNATPRPGKGAGRLRFFLGLAAILALAAWGLLSDSTLLDAPEARSVRGTVSSAAQAEQAPEFDDRGKWGATPAEA